MKTGISILVTLLIIVSGVHAGAIKVVTTTMDMKSIAEMIGGNKVSVQSIATGYQNPHFVDPKPSYIINLTNADVFVTVGLDLETGWSPQLPEKTTAYNLCSDKKIAATEYSQTEKNKVKN